jgi:hypothetical protein
MAGLFCLEVVLVTDTEKVHRLISEEFLDKDQNGYSGYASLLAHNLKATSDKVK